MDPNNNVPPNTVSNLSSPITANKSKPSSKFGMILLMILALLIAISSLYFFTFKGSLNKTVPLSQKTQNQTVKRTGLTTGKTSTSQNNITTNEQLDKDMQNIDNSMNKSTDELDNVDKGLNDQAVNLQ